MSSKLWPELIEQANPSDPISNPSCKDCKLYQGAQKVCMVGTGPLGAKILFVTDTLSEEEEKAGRPLVGKAGQLFTRILTDMGLSRQDVYVTSAIKCKNPEGRKPSRLEILNCRKYLLREIQLIQPKLIITFGSVAIQALANNVRLTLSEARTRYFKIFGIKVRSTYHPSVVFHTPYLLKIIYDDLSRFVGNIDREAKVRSKNLVRERLSHAGLEDHLKFLVNKDKPISLDIETNGLNPFAKDAKIWSVGFCQQEGEAYVIPIHHRGGFNPTPEESLRLINQYLLSNPSVLLVGHNIKFDLKWLSVFGAKVRCRLFDTMVAFHLLDENYPNKGLKHLSKLYTPLGDYSAKVKTLKAAYPDFHYPIDDLVFYNGSDVDAALRLHTKFSAELVEAGLERYMRWNMALLKTLLRMELTGIRVDRSIVFDLSERTEKKLAFTTHELQKIVGEINLASPKQVAAALFGKLRMPPIKRTEKGELSTDVEVLTTLATRHGCEAAKLMLTHRELSKLHGTYIKGMESRIEADGKVHTNYSLASNREGDGRSGRGGTVTGRLGSDMQQIPNEGGIKAMFVSRYKGGEICQADYSQIELRIMAHFSKDRAMIDAFSREKVDIHRKVAAKIYNKAEEDVTKEERRWTKTVNFGIVYCMGPTALATQLGVNVEKAKKFIREWYANYPAVERWIRKTQLQVIRDAQIKTLLGRIRHLPGASYLTSTGREILRQGVNSPIQGTASELTLWAMMLYQQHLDKHKAKSKLMLNIHDAVLVDVHPSERDLIEPDIKKIFLNLPLKETFDVELRVPLEIEVKFGRNWEIAAS